MKKSMLTILVILLAVIITGCAIDIKPGSDKNPINVKSNGVTPVAMLGENDPDSNVYDIDPDSATLNGVPAIEGKHSYEDVNDDGFLDLVVFFDTQELVASLSTTEDGAELLLCMVADYYYNSVWYYDELSGCDTIVVLNKGK